MTSSHQEEDAFSCATGFETLPASNIRRVTNNEGTGNKNGNQEHDDFLRIFVAELMWLVTVETEDLVVAAKNRRRILELLMITLSDQRKITHGMIYGLLMVMGCKTPEHLRFKFMAQFLKLLNKFDNNTTSYAQRDNFVSLIRGLLAEADSHGLPSHLSSAVAHHNVLSDITAHEGEDTTGAAAHEGEDTAACVVEGSGTILRLVHSVGHGMPASGNLAELGVAQMPSPNAPWPDITGLHLSASSSANSGSTILRTFRLGQYASLEQLNLDDLLRALSSNPDTLVSLLIILEGEASSRAREGNSDDFSCSGRKHRPLLWKGGSVKKPAAKYRKEPSSVLLARAI